MGDLMLDEAVFQGGNIPSEIPIQSEMTEESVDLQSPAKLLKEPVELNTRSVSAAIVERARFVGVRVQSRLHRRAGFIAQATKSRASRALESLKTNSHYSPSA